MLLLALACSEPTPEVVPPAPRAVATDPYDNVVIIVIDTLREDRALKADTPHLDGLASQGARAQRAWSAGTWTLPSVISMFSGASIREHGWDLPTGRIGKYPLVPDIPLLAEVLKAEGFRTDGLYSNGLLSEELGFHRGFDQWGRVSDLTMSKQFSAVVGKRWSPGERHFAYLHFLGPHSSLKPTDQARDKHDLDGPLWEKGLEIGAAKRNEDGARDAYRVGYTAVIEDTDARVGQVLEALGEYRQDTLIVVTSDHGELLGEHGVYGHGYWVYEPLTHVPFIVSAPVELPATVSTAALPQLVTDQLGISYTWPTQLDSSPLVSQREGKLALTVDGRKKQIWDDTGKTKKVGLFDLEIDPLEIAPIAGDLEAERAAWEAEVPRADPLKEVVELSDETQQELKALGYIE